MDEQQSQKRGVRSENQKLDRAREGYDPLPASQPVAGAFGEHASDTATDQDVAMRLDEKKARKSRNTNEPDE